MNKKPPANSKPSKPKFSSQKKELKPPLIKAAMKATSDIEMLGVNGLPLRPYLDDIWAAINGAPGSNIDNIENDIIAIQADIAVIQATCCGSDVFGDLDGGTPNSIYLIDQNVDGGGP